VLRLARGEKAIQDEQFELFTVVVPQKRPRYVIFKILMHFPKKSKKVQYLGNNWSFGNFAKDKKCSE